VVKSETGSGKTLGFILALLASLERNGELLGAGGRQEVRSIIMVPTRELAFQIHEWIRTFAGLADGVQVNSLVQVLVSEEEVGNQAQEQLLSSTTPLVIVGTGTRLQALAKAGKIPPLLKLERVFVDEVDKVLDVPTSYAPISKVLNRKVHPKPGALFLDYLLQHASTKYQTVVVSATANVATRGELTHRNWVKDPVRIQLGEDNVSLPESISHTFSFTPTFQEKVDELSRIASQPDFTAGLIFVGNETSVTNVAEKLRGAGIQAVYPLAGDYYAYKNLSPVDATQEKESPLSPNQGLLQGKVKFLVCREDASRGLDLPKISHVVVSEVPDNMPSFLHQSGRTGRMGAKGQVTTFYDSHTALRAKAFAGYLGLKNVAGEIARVSLESAPSERGIISPNKSPKKTSKK